MIFANESILPVLVSENEDSFERGAALDDLDIRVQSREFRSGTLTTVMSDVTVDLREASLSPQGATISVQSAFSGICIVVPRDWDVDLEIEAVFAGVDGERLPPPARETRPRLRLKGTIVAGGLCVR